MPINVERHLILVNRPRWQAVQDFEDIKQRIEAQAPDIEVFIATTEGPNISLRKRAAKRPTLVMCPSGLRQFRPRRGKVYHGRIVPKQEQINRLVALGIPAPLTTVLGPDTKLDPATWGSHVFLKPTSMRFASRGLGIAVVATEHLKYRPPESFPEDHAGRHTKFIVQQFIDTGDHATSYRVNTLFDRPLYSLRMRLDEPSPALDKDKPEIWDTRFTSNTLSVTKSRTFSNDPEIIALALRCHQAVPDVPVKGVDIVREAKSGKLYVLELNCGSATWHISSRYYDQYRNVGLSRAEMESQFGAFDRAAEVLIERTRKEAF
ncbi:MAG: hypothetical protein Q8L53_09805 [Aestuariivirga sp.]|nr:hypothetical protein [Aestuariivirga sp.]